MSKRKSIEEIINFIAENEIDEAHIKREYVDYTIEKVDSETQQKINNKPTELPGEHKEWQWDGEKWVQDYPY